MQEIKLQISVIVTVYNVEKYISRCIESVLNQTKPDFELVVVDDCTPDRSMEIVGQYADKDSRIRICRNEENSGLMWARKVGVEHAKGEYIVYLDSDDTLPENALEILFNEMIKTGADMVSGNIVYKKLDDTTEVWKSSLNYGNDAKGVYQSLLKSQYRHNLCGHIFKKSILDKPDLKYYKNFTKWEDYCLFYQLVNKATKVCHIDAPVYYYYQTSGSSTQVKISSRSLETTVIAHKIAYDLLCNDKDLEVYLFRNFQYCFCKLLKDGYYKVNDYLKQYDLCSVISNKNIMKHNTLGKALKLLVMKFPMFFHKG